MQDGVLNKNEDKKNIILAKIIQDQCGKAPDAKSVVCTCISSPCIDIDSADNTFHSARLKGMFSRLGWNVKIIEEGLAVVLSERPTTKDVDGKEIPYSGMGVSFGAGNKVRQLDLTYIFQEYREFFTSVYENFAGSNNICSPRYPLYLLSKRTQVF